MPLLLVAASVAPLMAQSWYGSAWTSRQKITIDSNSAAYGLTSDLTNFPFLIKVGAGNDLFSKAQAGGNDILFTTEDGVTKIPHQIENYDGAAPDLTAWVKLPVFHYDADTVIYIYYGNPTVASQQQPQDVWDNDFAGVWHLGENGSVSEYEDSTRNGNTGVGGSITTNNAPQISATSISGYSQDFDGADDTIKVPGHMGQPTSVTVSAWANLDAPGSVEGSTVFSIGDSLVLSLDHNNATGHVAGFIYDGTDWRVTDTAVTLAGTGWHHVAYRIDDATHRSYVYIDGVQQGTASYTGSPAYTLGADTYIGKHGNGSTGVEFNGRIDELRFSAESRSPDWIRTEYQTQAPSAQGAPASPSTVDNTKFIKQKGWQNRYFQYRRSVTIDKGMVIGTHTDFPVLVDLILDPAHVKSANGYDTMFTDSGGAVLPHEIESYDSGTGELWAWVKVPTLTSLSDTVLYLYYGNATVTTNPSSTAVWDSGFRMVQHMSQDPAGTAPQLPDSTSNGNNSTSHGTMTTGDLVDAKIGKGIDLDGADDYLSTAANASLNATTALTLSGWVNLANPGNDQKIFGSTNGPAPNRGYVMGAQTGGLYPEIWDAAGTRRSFTAGTIPAAAWTHVATTWTTGGNMIGYVNGAQVSSVAATANSIGAGTTGLIVGGAPWGPTTLRTTGVVDELRVSATVRSANWIRTEYNNQNDATVGAGKFIKSLGVEEAGYSSWWNPTWQYRKTLTLNADKVGANNIPKDDSDLRYMPVLLSFTDTDVAGSAQYSGNDIAFALSGTTAKLDHEIVSYTSATGAVIAWVKIPAISSSVDTLVDIYYGNGGAADQQNVTGTWSNGYAGVWHLEENVRGTSGAYEDSSPFGNDGTSGAIVVGGPPTQTTIANGKIGRAQDFDGIDDYVSVGSALGGPYAATISAWVRHDNLTTLVNRYVTFGNNVVIRHDGLASVGQLHSYVRTGGGTARHLRVNGVLANATWYQVAEIWDGTTQRMYLNGQEIASQVPPAASLDTPGDGSISAVAEPMDGIIDEVRASRTARSPGWIKAEYVNQNAPTSNITFDPPPTLTTWAGAGGASWSVDANWSPAVYPNDNTRQALIGGTIGPQLAENILVKRLTIQSAHSVDLLGYQLSIDDSGGLENLGTITFSGRAGASTDSISEMDVDSGTVAYRTTTPATVRDFGSVDYYDLTVDGITADLSSDITVAGSLSLANGATLNLNGHTLTVTGNLAGAGTVAVGSGTLVVSGQLTVSTLTATSGTIRAARDFDPGSFTAGTSIVELIDPAWNGRILGSRTFSTLRVVTPGKVVLFENGTTQTVTTFTVTGTIGAQVSLRSTTDGSQWTITPTNKSVSYAYVRDSVASSAIYANNSTSGGNNNANWIFNAAGQLHHFAISTVPSPQYAGQPFSITITAQDVSNATVAGFTGTVTIAERTGTISPVVSGSFVAGVRTETVNILNAATNVTIVVSDGSILGQSASFDVQTYTPFTGLIGHWRFDDGSGTTAVDSSVSSNPGTLTGGLTWAAGRVAGALDFGGTGHVSVANEATYDITGNITVAAWIKVDTFTIQWQTIAAKGDSAWRLLRNDTSNALCFAGTGLTADTVYGTRNVNDGQWHHAVGVYDGARLSLYVDGTLDASIASTGAIGTNNYNVFIGENAQATGRQFDGLIDDVRVYNRALGAAEVAALHNEPPPRVTSVTSPAADGTYFLASTLSVTVAFDEAVTVDTTGGTPRLLLETGTTDRYATFSAGSGTNVLTFTYTVASGDVSPDLDYVGTASLELNGGTIRDSVLNDAELTLPAPGAAGSLSYSKEIIIDSSEPAISSVTTGDADSDGQIDRLTIVFDTNVDIVDGSAADGLPQVVVTGYAIADADYAASNTTTLVLLLTESGSPDTGAAPQVTFTNDGDIRDSISAVPVADYGAAAASDGAGPAIAAAQSVTTTTVQVTFSEAVSDASLVVGDFVFASFATGGANANPTAITTGTADDAVVTLTLAAEIGPDETGTVALTAAGVASDLVPSASTQTAAVAVSDGMPAAPTITSVTTGDADSDGQLDRVTIVFDKGVDIADGSAADGFPQVTVAGYAIANADYAAAGTTTLVLTLTESGSADTGATPQVTFTNDGDVRDAVTHALAVNYGPAAATDGAGPAIVSAQSVTTTTVQVTFSEAVSDASLVVGDFVFASFATGGANANPTAITTGTADDAVVTLTLAAEIGPDEAGSVALTAAGVASDLVPSASTQTAAVAVSDGMPAAPTITSVTTGDADSDGQIDRVTIVFDKGVDIADGSAADGFPQVTVTGYTTANADYAAAGTTTLVLTLTESGSADTGATPQVTFTNDGDIRDSISAVPAADYGPAAATDGAGPAIVSAQSVTTTTVQVTFSEAVSDASLVVGDFVFASFATGGANANPTAITTGTADDAVVTLTLAAEIGPDEAGSVALTAAGVASDLVANASTQTAAAAVTDGIGAAPVITSVTTGDADSDGQIDRVTIVFDKNVDIADGSAADGFPQVTVAGYTIANADYAASNTTTLVLTLTESGSADTGATPQVTFTNDGDVRDAVTHALAVNYGPAAATDGAGPAIVSAQTLTITTVEVTFSEPVSDASLVVGDFVFASFATAGANAYPSAITTGTGDDAVVTLTLAAEIGPDEAGSVALTAAGVAGDLVANASTQTAAAAVTDGIGAAPVITSVTTGDADSDGQLDRVTIVFDKNVDIADGSAADGFPQVTVAGYTIANADYAASNTTTLVLTLTESGSADTGATPQVTFTNDGDVRDAVTHALAVNYGPAAATDGAGPAIVAAETVTTTTVQVTFSEAVSDASLVVGDFVFASFATGGANANPTAITTGTADDAVVTLTLAAEIGPDETGTVALTAVGAAVDLVASASTQTAAAAVVDGIPAAPTITSVTTGDADSDGQLDRVTIVFDKGVDIADGSAADGFPQVTVAGYTIANADYAASNTTTLVLTLTESGSADTGATPQVTFTNDGDVRDAVTHALAVNYGPAAATDGAGPAIVSAQSVTTTTVQVTFSEDVSDASLVVGDFVFASFATGGANANPSAITTGTGDDAVVTLTLAAEIGPDETGSVALTAAGVAGDLVANASTQTAAAAVTDGIGAAPVITSVTTGDADSDGQLDRVTIVFDKGVDIADGSAADGFPQVTVAGYAIANADYAAAGTTTLVLTLTESGSADTGATPQVTFTNDGDVRDAVTHALAVNYGPAAATDGAGPAIVSAQTLTITTVEVTFSEPVSDASLVVGDFVFASFATGGANANPTAITTGTADDAVVTLTLAAMIGPNETGTVALTAAGAASDLVPNASTQTTAVAVVDGIPSVAPVITSVATADADSDGGIDGLTLTFSRSVDIADGSAADGFPQVIVAGYTIANADYAASNTTTLVLTLTESGSADTGATPQVTFTNDGDVTDTASGTPAANYGPAAATDNAPPVILYTLAVVNEPRIAVHFSEAVSHAAAADFSYSGAVSVSSVPTSGTAAYIVVLTGAIPENEITGGAPATITISASVVDGVGLPVDAAGRSHRVSDLGLGIMVPTWALSDKAQGTVTTFNGAGSVQAGNISLQGRVIPATYAGVAVTSAYPTVDLVYDASVSSDYVSNGLWLPAAIPGLVPAANPAARTLPEVSSLNGTRDYLIPASDPEVQTGSEIQFFFDVGGLVHARVANPADPNTAAPWRLPIRAIVRQRGGVTIANNVINPDSGESTRLRIELESRGSLSVMVFDLKGDIVQVLHRGSADAGERELTWDGRNRSGQAVARGIYFIKVVGPDGLDETRKVMVVK